MKYFAFIAALVAILSIFVLTETAAQAPKPPAGPPSSKIGPKPPGPKPPAGPPAPGPKPPAGPPAPAPKPPGPPAPAPKPPVGPPAPVPKPPAPVPKPPAPVPKPPAGPPAPPKFRGGPGGRFRQPSVFPVFFPRPAKISFVKSVKTGLFAGVDFKGLSPIRVKFLKAAIMKSFSVDRFIIAPASASSLPELRAGLLSLTKSITAPSRSTIFRIAPKQFFSISQGISKNVATFREALIKQLDTKACDVRRSILCKKALAQVIESTLGNPLR